MFQEPFHQFLARIFLRLQFIQLRIARQQHLRFDVDQRRRHVNEFRAQLDVHGQRLLHVIQVLGSNLSDGDVVDVDLLLADQIQQQVEGPIIVLQMEI